MRLVDDHATRTVRPSRRPVSPNRSTGRPGRSTAQPPRVVPLVLLALVLAATVGGAWALAGRLFTSSPSLTAQASLRGLTATIAAAGWVGMDMQHTMDQGGFQMPAQMMPGAPEGDRMRLGIPITLHNTDGAEQWFSLADEFTVTGGAADAPVGLQSDTIGQLSRLAPGSAVNGVLYFDLIVPGPTDPPLVLHWERAGDTVDMVVPMMSGTMPGMDH